MPIEVLMPALSPTMSEGNLAKWHKKEGDRVEPGEVLAEIETDKATMEVEAVDGGTLGKIVVPEGTEGVAVNTPIAYLLEEGEDASALEGVGEKPAKGGDGQEQPAAQAQEPARAEQAPPAEPREAQAAALPQQQQQQQQAQPQPQPQPRQAPARGDGQAEAGGRIFASPLARRMAEQHGLDLARLSGSGPHGRIVKADIEKALAQPEAARAPEARAPEAPPTPVEPPRPEPAKAPPPPPPAAAYTEVPLSNMRKVIAQRLVQAKQTVPHFYLTIDCELDALLKLRKDLNAREGADYKLSVNDFVIRACALALRKVPDANASWGEKAILRYETVDISVAVAIPQGLITPIIRNADQKGLAAISNEMKELAGRAREGKLKPEEYQGGTFSVSNLGMYGIREFGAIINPPQSCILAVGAGEQRPIVKDGALATATMMSCTLSVDHRVVDGALGAQLLAAFKGFIEDPLSMLL